METLDLGLIIAIAVPLLLLQLGLIALALVDLIRRSQEEVRYLPKWGWAIVILLINFVGPIVYLVAGREEE